MDSGMTFSIAARDPKTGTVGIGVASRFFACGAMVAYVSGRAAFASQAFVNPIWGIDGLVRLEQGDAPGTILSDLLAGDQGHPNRQAHMIAPDGRMAQFTGADCVPWAGHVSTETMSAAGNMLAGPEVLEAMKTSWLSTEQHDLAERLLMALEAGEAAGGDKRGRQAAALCVHAGQPYPALDLRVDDHADPLAELRRLKDVSEERFALFRPALPTRENPSGQLDRTPLDQAIAEKEREMLRTGRPSRSHATGP